MSVSRFLILALGLSGVTAFAQTSTPDCSGPGAWAIAACQNGSISTNTSPAATSEEDALAAARFREDREAEEEAALWQSFRFSFDEPMQRESPIVSEDIITVTLSNGDRVPYVEIKREDGSIVERSPTLAETAAWRDAMALDAGTQRIPASRARFYAQSEESAPSDVNTASNSRNTNAARSQLEDMLDIPESHRGRDGTQCSEYETPDGSSSSRSCSRTWSWTSGD